MSKSSSRIRPLDHPIRNLVVLFTLWKAFLLLIACCSPGEGYDTSTTLVLSPEKSEVGIPLPVALGYLANKLTRWDAIYFVQAASRGYVFEQEWAFGWGFTQVINGVAVGEF